MLLENPTEHIMLDVSNKKRSFSKDPRWGRQVRDWMAFGQIRCGLLKASEHYQV